MSISNMFHADKLAQENAELKKELSSLQELLVPEMRDAVQLKKHIEDLSSRKEQLTEQTKIQQNYIERLQATIQEKQKTIVDLDEQMLFESFSLYVPKFEFAFSEQYKSRLSDIRNKQKELIKSGNAVKGNLNWTVNGSKSQGNKMVKDMQKLLLRAFNCECDDIVEHVKYNNFDKMLERMTSSCSAISNLGSIMNIYITEEYYRLKTDELRLALEYQLKKQQEKEEQKEIKAQMREEAKLMKEIEEARKKIEKEQKHYENALQQINKQIEQAGSENNEELIKKKEEILKHIDKINDDIKQIDYREANNKAGYVYIISNVGAFGENVYKIGMTRRLDPQERVDELGDASVPFNFDVHAMIFSDDAPKLEASLHKAFENRKVNMVNQRREFFNVSLDEIKKVVSENYDKTVEFYDYPEAQQYRTSLKMRGLV
ncbi:MAG: DUF4041 domain-containing protein [Oscillospiraceae bacterium]